MNGFLKVFGPRALALARVAQVQQADRLDRRRQREQRLDARSVEPADAHRANAKGRRGDHDVLQGHRAIEFPVVAPRHARAVPANDDRRLRVVVAVLPNCPLDPIDDRPLGDDDEVPGLYIARRRGGHRRAQKLFDLRALDRSAVLESPYAPPRVDCAEHDPFRYAHFFPLRAARAYARFPSPNGEAGTLDCPISHLSDQFHRR
jgi:hypothetical protein